MPARKIPKNYLNVTGRVSPSPNSDQAGFESLLEKDYMLILQFDLDVEHFEVQTIQVPVPGHRKPYTPDIFVRYKPGPRGGLFKPELIEVKPQEILLRKADEFAPKFKAATSFARARGWTFRICTEKDIRTTRLENIKFLREFKRRPPDPDREGAVIAKLRALGASASSDSLVQALDPSGDLESVTSWYPVVWRLVCEQRIAMDFDSPMGESVQLWLPNGAAHE